MDDKSFNTKYNMTVNQMKAMSCQRDKIFSIMGGHQDQAMTDSLWETEILDKHGLDKKILTQGQAQEYVNSILTAYGFGDRDVVVAFKDKSDIDGAEGCTYCEDDKATPQMFFTKETCSLYIVSHEASHAMLDMVGKREHNEHGADFVRVLCDVLHNIQGFDLAALIKDARDTGLSVSDDMPSDLVYRAQSNDKKAA